MNQTSTNSYLLLNETYADNFSDISASRVFSVLFNAVDAADNDDEDIVNITLS